MPPLVLREMRVADVPAVMAVQEPASIAGLSEVFPQDRHPFPREVLADRWCEEIADPGIECYVILRGSEIAGFAAVAGNEVKHFGVALDEWGSGLARTARRAPHLRAARSPPIGCETARPHPRHTHPDPKDRPWPADCSPSSTTSQRSLASPQPAWTTSAPPQVAPA